MDVTIDLFWTEYTASDNQNGPFGADEFIWKSKEICDGNSYLWHQKYSIPCTNILAFVSYRVTSKVVGIGTTDYSWGDVKTIKPGKISAISSYVSKKQSIVYTYACIESARIKHYNSDKNINDHYSSHNWNEDDDSFYWQLEKWGLGKLFWDEPEPVTKESRYYIEDRGKSIRREHDQRSHSPFL